MIWAFTVYLKVCWRWCNRFNNYYIIRNDEQILANVERSCEGMNTNKLATLNTQALFWNISNWEQGWNWYRDTVSPMHEPTAQYWSAEYSVLQLDWSTEYWSSNWSTLPGCPWKARAKIDKNPPIEKWMISRHKKGTIIMALFITITCLSQTWWDLWRREDLQQTWMRPNDFIWLVRNVFCW